MAATTPSLRTVTQQVREAEAYLSAADPVMAGLIRQHGPCGLVGDRRRDPFHVLCESIISQQLSTRAADTILARVLAGLGAEKHLQPAQLLAASPEKLRSFGLSNAKAKWLQHLGMAAGNGTLDFRVMAKLDDEAAIQMLDALPGIGRWTAEMFLMFALHRLDIFATDDVGLRRGVDQLYGKGKALNEAQTLKIARVWAPYRSVASWYLWRVTNPILASASASA